MSQVSRQHKRPRGNSAARQPRTSEPDLDAQQLFLEQTERKCLGAAVLNNATLDGPLAPLSAKHFPSGVHRNIFDVMRMLHAKGEPFDMDSVAYEFRKKHLPEPASGVDAYLDDCVTLVSFTEGRDQTLSQYAKTVIEASEKRDLLELGEKLERDARSGADPALLHVKYQEAFAQLAYKPPGSRPDLLQYMQNDTGNGERLLVFYGLDRLRYCSAFKKWLVWDGRRWAVDDAQQAQYLAKQAILEYLRQAVETRDESSQEFASTSLEMKRIEPMLKNVHFEFHAGVSELDTNPWLLNFQNGTVDLRTSQLRPHQPSDFITKLIHYHYNPEAECLGWLMFLERIMGGGPAASQPASERAWRLVDYLQRSLGYSLTGSTIEKAVFLPFGGGDNGKTTLLSSFRNLVTEYSTLLQVDTLMTRQESNNSQADLADLRGVRFAQTSETEDGQRLAQGKLKRITQGMGEIRAVRKYENPFSFPETHKLWFDANFKPLIRNADDRALFNRLHPIPFTVTIPKEEQDKEMPAKLVAEAEGILAWAVKGARLWHESGLNKPPEVDDANKQWHDESDQLGRFIEECCVVGDGFSARASLVYGEYKRWCETGNEHTITATAFGLKLSDRFAKGENKKGTRYHGIGVKAEKPEAEED